MADEGKLVRITGGPLPEEIDQELVDMLTELRDRAQRGEIVGLAYAGITGGRKTVTGWLGNYGTHHSLMASVSVLWARYTEMLREGEVET